MGLIVVVAPPNPDWPAEFMAEAARILAALPAAGVVEGIHHIGSTAVAGLWAKPVIDMLMVARSLPQLDDAAAPALQRLGYQVMGEFGLAGRRYFRKDSAQGVRTHQLHAYALGSAAAIERHLAFRDYLRAHPAAAAAYGDLKRQLAEQHAGNPAAYMDGKDAFVKQHEALALQWLQRRKQPGQQAPE